MKRLALLALCACGGGPSGDGQPGRCDAPAMITLPFTAPDTSATAGPADDTSLSCAAPMNLPEAVYRFTLTTAGGVVLTADDQSGQGIGADIREGVRCGGVSRFCRWSSLGTLGERVSLPGGQYVLILERVPEGRFSLKLE